MLLRWCCRAYCFQLSGFNSGFWVTPFCGFGVVLLEIFALVCGLNLDLNSLFGGDGMCCVVLV